MSNLLFVRKKTADSESLSKVTCLPLKVVFAILTASSRACSSASRGDRLLRRSATIESTAPLESLATAATPDSSLWVRLGVVENVFISCLPDVPTQNFCSRSDTVFGGVFDGHGPLGHMVAKRVRDYLPLKLSANWEFNTTSEDVLREISLNTTGTINSVDTPFLSADEESRVPMDLEETEKQSDIFQTMKDSFLKAFKVMDRELRVQTSIDCFCSGTTAVTLIKQGQHLIIGNVGDSRAVLGARDKDGSLIAVQLTVDLKPNVPAEAERIHKCRGRVFALCDDPEVARVWLPNYDSPGLAMARAFGDFCLKDFGLISVPDMSCRHLSEKDEFIVLATDGIWDVLSNKEVVDIVASAPTRSSAARALVESAVRSWKYKHPISKVDDCAVVCLFLDSNNLSAASNTTSKDQLDDYLKQDKAQTELPRVDSSALEGVFRVDTLLKLPRFVPGKEDKKAAAEAQAAWK